jgi:hypothetical protein
MLMLFKPWRSLGDICADGESWLDAFERCHFSDECISVMANMEVENKCEDARREIRDASVGSIETIGQMVEAQDGNLNSLEVSLINESEENPELEFLLENGVGPALNESARDVVEALERVHLMQYDLLEQEGVEEQGGCDLMNEDDPDVLRKHGELMKNLKKRKRPEPLPNVSSPETSPSK